MKIIKMTTSPLDELFSRLSKDGDIDKNALRVVALNSCLQMLNEDQIMEVISNVESHQQAEWELIQEYNERSRSDHLRRLSEAAREVL